MVFKWVFDPHAFEIFIRTKAPYINKYGLPRGYFDTCTYDEVKNGKVALTKSGVDGRAWTIVSINCLDERAKNLYEAVAPYSTEQYVRYRDGRRGIGRFFGRLYPPSQCVRVVSASRGSEANFYSCRIFVDLDYELIQKLHL